MLVSFDFAPLLKNPGDMIRSEDWNKVQKAIIDLKEYLERMAETVILAGLDSPVGKQYVLDEIVPGENDHYYAKALGLITKQWVPAVKGKGDICIFGVMDYLDELYYWSGAENGDQNTLKIVLGYLDGTMDTVGENLFINNRARLTAKSKDNPYVAFLEGPNKNVWYKYLVKNRHHEKELMSIHFINTNEKCTPRIGNAIHLRSRLRLLL